MNKKLISVLLSLIIITLTACGGSKEATSEEAQRKAIETFLESFTKEGKSRCIIRLMPERSSYYTGEDGTVTFSVIIPKDRMTELGVSADSIKKKIDIIDSAGKACAEISPESLSMDEQGNVLGDVSFVIDTKEDGAYSFYARTEDYTSALTTIYVTPHITEKQTIEALEVGGDLTAFLEDNYSEEDSDDTLVEAATSFLEQDERVAQVLTEGTAVTFTTSAGIISVFNAKATDPELLSESSETAEEFETETQTTSLYRQYGDGVSVQTADGPVRLDVGNTLSNGNVLILRPATNAMKDIQMGQLKSAAKKINKITDSSIVTEYKDDEAVRAVMSGELVNYGTVMLQTHGGILTKQVNGVSTTCGVSYLMYREKTFREKTIANNLEEKLRDYSQMEYEISSGSGSQDQLDEFYRQFYGKIGEPDTWRMYFSYARDFDESVGLRFAGDIAMTSGYLMERYATASFDNTVFYIGACYGASYPSFNEWLLNHGCQVVLGYSNSVNVKMSLLDFNDLFDQLTANSHQVAWRTEDLSEANENNENRFFNLVENIAQESLRKISDWINKSTEMLLIGNDGFFYRGDGTLDGSVYYRYIFEEGRTEERPCVGASVTPHLFKNQAFEEKREVKTDNNGSFSFEKMRCGVYAIEVKNDLNQENVVSIVFDQESLDGGKIYLPGPSLRGKVIEKQTGKPIEGAAVELTGKRDGDKHELMTDEEGVWEWTYATQQYNVVVSYEDYSDVVYSDVIPSTNQDIIVTEMQSFDWYIYIRDELAPMYGYADMDQASKKVDGETAFNADSGMRGWVIRDGIAGVDVLDMTGDGNEDLLLYRFEPDEYALNGYNLLVDFYVENDGKVTLNGRHKLSGSSGASYVSCRVGIITVEGTPYLWCENNSNAYFANGSEFWADFYGCDNDNLVRRWMNGKTDGGSSDIAYSLVEYSDNNISDKNVLYGQNGPFLGKILSEDSVPGADCESPGTAVEEGYNLLGLPETAKLEYPYSDWTIYDIRGVNDKNIFPTYWETDTVKKSLEMNTSGEYYVSGYMGGRYMTDTVTDFTDLMEKVQ